MIDSTPPMERLSRRDALKILATLFGSAGLGYGAGALIGRSYFVKNLLGIPNLSEEENKNVDPIFRAATVRFVASDDVDGGHGSIIESEGELYLYTAGHVARQRRNDGLSSFNTIIQGVGRMYVPFEDAILSPKLTLGDDQAATYHFSKELETTIRTAIDVGILRPLIFSNTLPQEGDIVAMPQPRAGIFNFYTRTGYEEYDNLFWYDSHDIPKEKRGCTGDSGSPILKTITSFKGGLMVTRELVGVAVEGGFGSDNIYKGRSCFTGFGGRDHD